MKKLAFSLLAAVLLFGACKKDDEKASNNSFTVNGKTYQTPHGLIVDRGEEGEIVILSSIDVSDKTISGKVNAVDIYLDDFTDGLTYTYMSFDDAGFDAKKNFSAATLINDIEYTKGVYDNTTGTSTDDIKTGTVSVKRNNNNVTISYTLEFADATVKGQYEGPLTTLK
jgi:hypothetical protein